MGESQFRFPEMIPYNLGDMIHNYAEQAASFAAGRVGGVLRNTAAILMDTGFTILAMFYFYRGRSGDRGQAAGWAAF